MNWNVLGRTLRLACLLRVPLAALLILTILGPLALNSTLLGNLLDQGTRRWYLFTVSFAAFMLAFTAITTLNLVLHYGQDRLDEGGALQLGQKRPLLTFVVGCAAAVTLDICVYLRTIPRNGWNAALLVLGFLTAFGLVAAAKVVQLALTDPKSTKHPPPFLVFPAYLIPALEHLLDRLYCWRSERAKRYKRIFNRLSQWPLGILRNAGQGYLIDLNPPAGEPLRLRSGHVFSLSLFVIAFFSYLGIGLVKSRITDRDAEVPALAFVLLFFIVACWSLSFLTFFFDRYRFPLLWTILVLGTITASTPQSDHFFRVEKNDAGFAEPITAAEYVRMRSAPGRPRMILVATPGGGIQAAAWTAEVLTQLNRETAGFRESVALISSVSGGSLGAIIYAASFAKTIDENDVPKNARRSAIDEVAWGWTVPDFWRTILPWFRHDRTVDRGWALERKWAAVNRLNDTGGRQGTMLSDWGEAARNGTMPALLINSMLVERGQPVVFATTRFPRERKATNRIANFYDLYPGRYRHYDIRVNTAARLSASFPYVAPASRPSLDAPYGDGFHFVDGGYYDNFGINSLLAWLDEALQDENIRKQTPDILILQIRHFKPDNAAKAGRAGWTFQIEAPLLALFKMRDFAQDSVARNQLKFFGRYYAERNVNIWQTSVAYSGTGACKDAPLSWKLDEQQQSCVDLGWQAVKDENAREIANQQPSALACIDAWVKGGDPAKNCARAADAME